MLGCVPWKLLTRALDVVLCPHFTDKDTEALESQVPRLWGLKACVSRATLVVSSLNYARASSGAKCPHIHLEFREGGSPPHSCVKPIMGSLALFSVADGSTVETGDCVWNRDPQFLCGGLHSVPVPSRLWLSRPLPQYVNPVAASLIQKMLQTDPAARPTIHELLNEEFFTSGYIPARLPITCLTVPPRFSLAPSSLDPSSRKPLSVLNKGKTGPGQQQAPREGLGLSCGCVAPRAGCAVRQALVLPRQMPFPSASWERQTLPWPNRPVRPQKRVDHTPHLENSYQLKKFLTRLYGPLKKCEIFQIHRT